MRARASGTLWKFSGIAALLVLAALFALRPLLREKPVRVSLAVGTRRTLPVSGTELQTVLDHADIIRLDRDRRGRLVVEGQRRGRTRLDVFAGARLRKRFEIEVTPTPPRRIEVVARRIPKRPRPRTRLAERPTLEPLPPPESRPPPDVPEPRARQPEPPKREPRRLAEAPRRKPEEKRPTEPKPKAVPLPEREPGKKMVELDEANRKKPKESKYLAQEDSAVERETRAIDTTLIKTRPGQEQPDRARAQPRPGEERPEVARDREVSPRQAKERRVAVAPLSGQPPRRAQRASRAEVPRPSAEPLPERGAIVRDEVPGIRLRRFRLFPTAQEIAEVLRQVPRPATAAQEAEEERRATRMPGGKWARIWSRVRGFLENFIPEVQPGTHTALNATRHAFAAYIARAHRKIHVQWGYGLWQNFRDLPDPLGSSPYQSSIYARLEIKLDRKGRVLRVGLVKTSGHTAFDGATMASVLAAAPFGPPPPEMVSRDGSTYLHWNFYQDGRQCWTNDVQVFVRDS